MDILNNPDLLADAPSLLGFINYFTYYLTLALFSTAIINFLIASILMLLPRQIYKCPKPGYGPNGRTCMECHRYIPVESQIAHNERKIVELTAREDSREGDGEGHAFPTNRP